MKASKPAFLLTTSVLPLGAVLVSGAAHSPVRVETPAAAVSLSIARIYWEYNASANDLGVHVSLDGEDWKGLSIENPNGRTLFRVKGNGPKKSSA